MRHAHLGRSELRDLWRQAGGRGERVEIPFVTGLHSRERVWVKRARITRSGS